LSGRISGVERQKAKLAVDEKSNYDVSEKRLEYNAELFRLKDELARIEVLNFFKLF